MCNIHRFVQMMAMIAGGDPDDIHVREAKGERGLVIIYTMMPDDSEMPLFVGAGPELAAQLPQLMSGGKAQEQLQERPAEPASNVLWFNKGPVL